jgi:hypothetical protein
VLRERAGGARAAAMRRRPIDAQTSLVRSLSRERECMHIRNFAAAHRDKAHNTNAVYGELRAHKLRLMRVELIKSRISARLFVLQPEAICKERDIRVGFCVSVTVLLAYDSDVGLQWLHLIKYFVQLEGERRRVY